MRKALLIVSVAVFGLSFGGGEGTKDKTVPAVDTAETVIADSDSGDSIDKLFNGLFDDGYIIRLDCYCCHKSGRYLSLDTAKLKLTGNRSKLSVGRVINKDIVSLRYVYNRRLRDNPRLCGTITVTFAIDEFGKVISAQVVESTANDTTLENGILRTIQESHSPSPMDGSIRWYFGEIDKSGDTTVVTYPFNFSQ